VEQYQQVPKFKYSFMRK